MNRNASIAAIVLSLSAIGSAWAESPNASPVAAAVSTSASAAPAQVVTGSTHDFDFGTATAVSTRSRAEVRQEVLDAISSGSLRVFGDIDPGARPAPAQPARVLARVGR